MTMHAHQQTLLARLGFADPDKADPLHDVACQYLCQPEVATKIAATLHPRRAKLSQYEPDGTVILEWVECDQWQLGGSRQESVISKGHGQYKTHIGFLDVCLSIDCRECCALVHADGKRGEDGRVAKAERILDRKPLHERRVYSSVTIEVKIQRVPASEIVRQINLYREYCTATWWLAVTAFSLSAEAVATLKNEKIEHLKLGESFDKYVAQRRAAGTVEHNSPEI